MSSDLKSNKHQNNINDSNSTLYWIYEFEGFSLDADNLMLSRVGVEVSLPPKVIETLLALIETEGEIVAKDKLMQRLWANSFVEESNLIQNIYLLRKTLGQTSDGKPMIETLRRRGYRFNAAVTKSKKAIKVSPKTIQAPKGSTANNVIMFPHEIIVTDESDGNVFPKLIESAEPQTAAKFFDESNETLELKPKSHNGWSPRFIVILLIGLISAAMVLAFGINRFSTGKNQIRQNSSFQNISFKKVAGSDGGYSPTIAPDGKTAAYRDENSVIWIENLANGSRMQLKNGDEPIKGIWLEFSPDGNYLYYVKIEKDEPNSIYQISIPSGTPRKVASDAWTGAAISPDGKQIAFARMNVGAGEYSLLTINTDGSSERQIATHRIPNFFSLYGNTLAWSPDGRAIACIGYAPDYQSGDSPHILIVNIDDGAEFAVPNPVWQTKDFDELTWKPDGDGLLVTARDSLNSPAQIWQVSYPSGEWSRVTNDLNKYSKIDVSADGKTLVTAQEKNYSHLWLLTPNDSNQARQITFGQSNMDGSNGVAFTPDNKSIVFVSNLSGENEIWKANFDGANARQITFGNENTESPAITPDNRYIVYTATNNGKSHIWRVNLDGSNPVRITDSNIEEWQPSVTPDSHYVIYTAETAPVTTLWRVSIDGGETVQLTEKHSVSAPVISPDGKWIAHSFYNDQSKSPWQTAITPITGGEPIKTFDLEVFRGIVRWARDSQSLLFIEKNASNIWRQSLADNTSVPVTDFQSEVIRNFAVSPDGKLLLLARGNAETSITTIQSSP